MFITPSRIVSQKLSEELNDLFSLYNYNNGLSIYLLFNITEHFLVHLLHVSCHGVDCGTEEVWVRPLSFLRKSCVLFFVLRHSNLITDKNNKKEQFNELRISMRTYIVYCHVYYWHWTTESTSSLAAKDVPRRVIVALHIYRMFIYVNWLAIHVI